MRPRLIQTWIVLGAGMNLVVQGSRECCAYIKSSGNALDPTRFMGTLCPKADWALCGQCCVPTGDSIATDPIQAPWNCSVPFSQGAWNQYYWSVSFPKSGTSYITVKRSSVINKCWVTQNSSLTSCWQLQSPKQKKNATLSSSFLQALNLPPIYPFQTAWTNPGLGGVKSLSRQKTTSEVEMAPVHSDIRPQFQRNQTSVGVGGYLRSYPQISAP
jgi:hypothetical protein